VLHYLERLTTNYVFPLADNCNGLRASELFILWAALYRTAVNTSTFIVNRLDEHTKSTKVVIGWSGIITALAKALGYGAWVDTLSVCTTQVALICSLAST